jgi:sigma-B regulation protein RsbU (phosphoserine phosphatase)
MRDAMGSPREAIQPYLGYAALALLFAISVTYQVRDTVDRFDEMRNGHRLVKLPFNLDFPQFEVSERQPEAEAAGLESGDTIVGVEGRPLRHISDLYGPLRTGRAGDRLMLDVQRSDQPQARTRTVSIDLQPIRTGPPSAYDWAFFAIVYLAMPYLCIALGYWVAAVRIRQRLAWLLLVVLLSLAEFAGGNWRTLFGRDDMFQPIAAAYQPVLANVWPLSMMLFGIYFPDRLALDRRFPWAKWIVAVPIALRVIGIAITLELLHFGSLAAARQTDRFFERFAGLVLVLHLVAIIVFFAAMAYKTVTASSPDARRRLLLLDAGALIGITPIVVYIILLVTEVVELSTWAVPLLLGGLFIFPLTMAYVIVVHRAMDVRVVVRQGLQYLLARGSLRTLQIGLSVLIVAAASTMSAASNPVGRIGLISAGLAAVVLIQTSADRVRRWMDRRFFREAYNAELILSDLANKVRTIVETGPLLQMVAHRVSDTLHVPRVAIFLNGGGTLRPAYALGHSELAALPLRHDTLTPDVERTLQQTLGAELLLPLSSNQKLIGVMSLGPKQSEEAFSGSDVRLLDAVAAQTGLALENSRLTAEIAAEVALREKARRELEIAREVQERLFPQEYPPIPGLDYAGACRPALGVGGDYYDFIRISPAELGIAIGDVSGKGIPAALLMATLRAYLRGQTLRPATDKDLRPATDKDLRPATDKDLSLLMSNLNALVYESSASNRYATFFYGQFDAGTRVLRYVNAGHNPPMIVGKDARRLQRLDAGGPVIGLMEGCRYAEGRATLEPGDVVVLFTDGITEAMNAADEEWGEEHLIEAVRPCRALQARDLIGRLMQSADAFVAGAPQHDDMTLVILRVL